MAFYYESEPPVWQFKDRYQWIDLAAKEARKLERVWKKVQDNNTAETKVMVTHKNTNYQMNVLAMQGEQKDNHTHSWSFRQHCELSRQGYPYPKPGNKNSLAKLFAKYEDPEDKDYVADASIPKLFKSIQVPDND